MEKLTGFPVTHDSAVPRSSTTAAVTVFSPVAPPRVQPAVAMPRESAVTVDGETVPPPALAVNLTRAPAAGPPMRLVTWTRIESVTTAPGVAAVGGVHWSGATLAAPIQIT